MGNSSGWLRPRGVHQGARCPGLVEPQPVRAVPAGMALAPPAPDRVSRHGARRNAHPAPLGSTRQATAISVARRCPPAQPRIADRSNEPIASWPARRPKRRSPPQGAWFDGDMGTSAGERARVRVLVLIDGADGGHGRLVGSGVRVDRFQSADPAAPFGSTTSWVAPLPDIGGTDHALSPAAASVVLQRPRRIHTGVALPGRSHVRVCRPAFMLCLVHNSGIRCLAVLVSIGSARPGRAFALRQPHSPSWIWSSLRNFVPLMPRSRLPSVASCRTLRIASR